MSDRGRMANKCGYITQTLKMMVVESTEQNKQTKRQFSATLGRNIWDKGVEIWFV